MKYVICSLLSFVFVLSVFQAVGSAQTGRVTISDVESCKKLIDDPSPYFECNEHYRKWLSPEDWELLTHDPEEMKKAWAEVVGFKAPDVVGKTAPEIKPGKYTHADKGAYPFKDLMPSYYYDKFNPPGQGGPNHVGNFTEIEIIPTRQYYYPLPVTAATGKNTGKTKLDDKGYIIEETYESGLPFPRPSGDQKGWQLVYNFDKRYFDFESVLAPDQTAGVNRNFKIDRKGTGYFYKMKTKGRLSMPPHGWLDERARKLGEGMIVFYEALSPRDEYGNALSVTAYLDPEKAYNFLYYYNAIRRVRKLSDSDQQDQAVGLDACYDDTDGFAQKISPTIYPFKVNVLEEREYLLPAFTIDGSTWFDSKEKFELKNLKFERRPVYVVELKMLDSNYIYSRRVLFMDQETFQVHFTMNYDQKGRLYRTLAWVWAFIPEMGTILTFQEIMLDHIDVHSTIGNAVSIPAPYLTRRDFNIKRITARK